MREIFSVRFFAAVGGVAALLFLVSTFVAARTVVDDDGDDASAPEFRRVDLIERVETASATAIGLDRDGLTIATVDLTIDVSRVVRVAPGTPAILHCQPATPGACAVVADLLGEAVVWFALVPMSGSPTAVQLPAIDTLDDGLATLVNGWQVRYAAVLDRRCVDPQGNDEEFESYREFREMFEDRFISVFDVPSQELVAVVCRVQVPYAATSSGPSVPPASAPGPRVTAPIPTLAPAAVPSAPATPAPGSTVVNEG